MVTCLVDTLAPHVGRAAVNSLESAGCHVDFPADQTCCGQPAMNVGHTDRARQMAAHTLDVFDATVGPIVIPSGSCAEMIIHHYPRLFSGTEREAQAHRVAARVRELTSFLIEDTERPATASCDRPVALHYSCHGLRGLGLDASADRIMEDTNRIPLEGDRECCGFGGVFSIQMPDVSAAIMDAKLDRVEESGAEVLVGGDISCLIHLEGGLRRRGSTIEVKHIVELIDDD